jgi:hypothetical protein
LVVNDGWSRELLRAIRRVGRVDAVGHSQIGTNGSRPCGVSVCEIGRHEGQPLQEKDP